MSSAVRRFLVQNLKSGMVAKAALRVAMSGADIDKAVSGGPIPDGSVGIDFSVAQAVFTVAEGLPAVSRADVSGRISGIRADLRAPTARVEMADGHALDASQGSFLLPDMWRKDAAAAIGFRLQGGADGLGALLQSPLIHEIAGIELDPATMKGRADLRVQLPLQVNNLPKVADLPLSVSGTVSDLSIDKLFGRDRLDGGNLSVAYDRGTLAIKGDGKLAGSPATIDVRRTRDAGGEADVTFTLDDAGRARRGLALGSQLTGPVSIKAALPLGKSAKSGIRVEADLAKAGVEQLVPGWVKAPGKPGKLAFTLLEGPSKRDPGPAARQRPRAVARVGHFVFRRRAGQGRVHHVQAVPRRRHAGPDRANQQPL